MHIDEYGPKDGTPITFLHGSMVAGWMWIGQVDGLPEYRCLLPDLPGIGKSGHEKWGGFPDAADRVADEIRSRVGSSHVVGLSLGGIVGLYLARQHPDVVRSLLVSGVPHGQVPAPLRLVNRLFLSLYTRRWGAGIVARAFGIPDDESRAAFLETAATTDPDALKRIAALNEEDNRSIPDGLQEYEVKTLAVVGEKDTQIARNAVPYLATHIPDAVGAVVPEVGHQWNAENPRLFADMVRHWIEDGRPHPELKVFGL